ncbi:MCE family protein, partial [Mycolicibacterium vaccae]|nr:MCE family protein [Mycolicibacterium vaccae]
MMSRLTRAQLAIFGVVTVITVTLMAIFYLRLPAAMGVGTYRVTADFVAGGGLYQNANVTYRGVAVGRVESVTLNSHGVDAVMRLNSGTSVPSNVTATVKSVSAVGEQYVDLVPDKTPATTKAAQRFAHRAGEHQDRSGHRDLLHESETLVNSVADTRLSDCCTKV